MTPLDFAFRTRVIQGPGTVARLSDLARETGARKALLVADHGIVAAGHAARAQALLESAGIEIESYSDFTENPESEPVHRAAVLLQERGFELIVGLGGGSSMDMAKAVNFILTNGGRIQDYWGYGKAAKPLLPMIGIPTTTGTGSEAQTHCLISDSATHVKMAIGAESAAFRVAILDPELALTQPRGVLAVSGYDAISHAVETYVTTRRTAFSDMLSREAWRLLDGNFEGGLNEPSVDNIANMQLGAFFAGAAIEASMLGATHACANPLTARYGTTHGVAIASLLSHVTRWNAQHRHKELHRSLPSRLRALAKAAGLPSRLKDINVPEEDLPKLAEAASVQWTGKFNPKPFDAAAALEIYRCAY